MFEIKESFTNNNSLHHINMFLKLMPKSFFYQHLIPILCCNHPFKSDPVFPVASILEGFLFSQSLFFFELLRININGLYEFFHLPSSFELTIQFVLPHISPCGEPLSVWYVEIKREV